MPLRLSPEAQRARDFAKRCVPPGQEMELGLLVSAIYHGSDLHETVPEFGPYLTEPEEQTDTTPQQVPLSQALIPIITKASRRGDEALSSEDWFVDLLWSPTGMAFAEGAGIPEEILNSALPKLRDPGTSPGGASHDEAARSRWSTPSRGWRGSSARKKLLDELNEFGRVLTEGPPPREGLVGMEEEVGAVLRALVKRKQRSALVIGEPGTGKTALVREIARRLMEGHPSIPPPLRNRDIFELSPTFLRSGTTLVGQYDERIATLIQNLRDHPEMILFVDEVHALLQSGIHERGNFTDANEAFKKALAQGEISIIGATTTSEFRYYLAPDQALVQRFSLIRITPPSARETREILSGRKEEIGGFYGVALPDEVLSQAVDLTEEYLPSRAQPRKSIQLLDEACAYCVTRDPILETMTEEALWEALESTIGHSLVREETLTEEGVFTSLSDKIVGQDTVLRSLSRAFVSGLSGWSSDREAPRGVFFFGGPTGVGKTATAVLLGEVLGGGRKSLVRVDCNTLQPSGGDSGQAQHILLGPPPGYIGYVRGKGGLLSRVRDHPESIVLFDEIEKADPGVGEILLQIMDTGRCEDSDGNLLDFRRSFLVFTTNAGATYGEEAVIGFTSDEALKTPKTDVEAMRGEILRMGLGQEFLGRISHSFIFQALSPESVQTILRIQLEALKDTAEIRGYRLVWDEEVVSHLVAQWQPSFGVRHLLAILRNRIVEHLSVADAQGELKGIREIRLARMAPEQAMAATSIPGLATRSRVGDALVLNLA